MYTCNLYNIAQQLYFNKSKQTSKKIKMKCEQHKQKIQLSEQDLLVTSFRSSLGRIKVKTHGEEFSGSNDAQIKEP